MKQTTFGELMGGSVFDTKQCNNVLKLNTHSAFGEYCPHCGLQTKNAVDYFGYIVHICKDEIVWTK